jgi:beta-glucosidase
MGYRGTDRSGIDPLFPFGFGLSYTTFELSGLRLSEPEAGDETLRAVCTVKNTGHRPGAEVVQLYIGDPESSVPRPVRELKGFQRVELQPGESRRVVVALSERDFSFFDAETKQWVFEPGACDVFVGSSSRNLPLSQRMVLPIRGK